VQMNLTMVPCGSVKDFSSHGIGASDDDGGACGVEELKSVHALSRTPGGFVEGGSGGPGSVSHRASDGPWL